MCKKMLSPADDAGSRVPPCAAGYLQINLSDPLGESAMEEYLEAGEMPQTL